MFLLASNLPKTISNFWPSKLHWKKSVKTTCIFPADKLHWKKIRENNEDFSTSKITPIKVRGNNVDFSTIEYTSKRVHRKNVDSSTIKIISKKALGNNVDYSTIETRWKEYLEATWIFWSAKLHWKSTRKWRGNLSKFCLPRINIIPTSNWYGFDVVCPLGVVFNDHQTLHENKNFRLTKICEKDRKDHIFTSFRIFSFHENIIFSELFFKQKCEKAASFHKCVFLLKYEIFVYDSCA